MLGFRDFSLPLNVSPAISIRPISVYLQYPAKVAGVSMERPLICTSFRQLGVSAMGHFTVMCSVPWPLDRSEVEVLLQTFLLFTCKSCYSHVNKPVSVVINMSKTVAWKQALRGALAAKREKGGQVGTTSLEFEYLHRKSSCEMLFGGDDISTHGTCFSMFIYIRARFRVAQIGRNLTAQWTGSHRVIGGGFQIPET